MGYIMKKWVFILIIIGSIFLLLNQLLTLIFYKTVSTALGSFNLLGYGMVIGYLVVNIIWISTYTILTLLKGKLTKNYTGAILGLVFSVTTILLSWLFVTWIFWALNLIFSILITIAMSVIIKDNRENL